MDKSQDQGIPTDAPNASTEPRVADKPSVFNQQRRTALNRILTAGGAAAIAGILPNQWTKPILGSIIPEAEAQTSSTTSTTSTTQAPRSGDGNHQCRLILHNC